MFLKVQFSIEVLGTSDRAVEYDLKHENVIN